MPDNVGLVIIGQITMQQSFSELEYSQKRKKTRRDIFLETLETAAPWADIEAQIEPCYPKRNGAGRPTIGLSRMLRMYVAQQCFGLSDEGIEDAIYDSQSIRSFVGIDLNREGAPDATTLLKFRRLLETHNLTAKIFEVINVHLAAQGLLLKEGTIIDATLIAAPSSTKNKDDSRDPEMRQSKKGKTWHFGMKAHIGVDLASGLVHTVKATTGNISDISQAHELLHGEEKIVLADAGYQGVEKRADTKDIPVEWHIAMPINKRRMLPEDDLGNSRENLEHVKASIRAKVEHPFHVLKNLFRHRKTRYRGIAKNASQLMTLFGLANLVLAARRFRMPDTRNGFRAGKKVA